MIRYLFSFLFLILFVFSSNAQYRKEIQIPDIPGFVTLKCDFHIHTVFSDGNVWPTVRIREAWEQGLDAIAITDHIEYRPHADDMKKDLNRSYEIAKPAADQAGIMLIRGTEITRKMPPGHLNALFITDANKIEVDDWFEACKEAKNQGAFIFWNHPGWKAQQPEKTLWWEEHTRLYDAGLMNGIEAYNSDEYYPEALQWSREKGLTILANSDIHDPIGYNYDPAVTHRPVTLVFAAERSVDAIKKALENRQTAIYFEDKLVGEKKFLEPIFKASVKVISAPAKLENKKTRYVMVHNSSDVDFILKSTQNSVGYSYKKEVILKANRTTMIDLSGKSEDVKNQLVFNLEYEVKNLVIAPEECLKVRIEVANQ